MSTEELYRHPRDAGDRSLKPTCAKIFDCAQVLCSRDSSGPFRSRDSRASRLKKLWLSMGAASAACTVLSRGRLISTFFPSYIPIADSRECGLLERPPSRLDFLRLLESTTRSFGQSWPCQEIRVLHCKLETLSVFVDLVPLAIVVWELQEKR